MVDYSHSKSIAIWAGIIFIVLLIGYPITANTSRNQEIGRYQVVALSNFTALKLDTATGATQILFPSNKTQEDIAELFAWFDIGHIQQLQNFRNSFEKDAEQINPLEEIYRNEKK